MIAYQDEWATLYTGTALDVLREMPSQSVHCAITSPPYWGLRSYLSADHPDKGSELGTEKTPDEFVAKLVEVFGELWRVLRDDGQLWCNIGDSYAAGKSGRGDAERPNGQGVVYGGKQVAIAAAPLNRKAPPGLKPKDLCMIPARLAIALQSWGWYLRQELVWAKDSAMPESVKDRCTRSHEYIYMLTKRPRYFYDSVAIAEPSVATHGSGNGFKRPEQLSRGGRGQSEPWNPVEGGTRNARSVWRINPRPYPNQHFAVFPPGLPMRCIKAGTSEKGVCSFAECGAPWRRVLEHDYIERGQARTPTGKSHKPYGTVPGSNTRGVPDRHSHTVGWEPTCTHETDVIPATVLDPFAGSGTTLYAARSLGRKSIGIDLDEKSAELLRERFGDQGVLL